MKNVLVRLREYEKRASSAEKEAVRLMLSKPEQITKYSIHEMARKAYTSPSTIVRLCNKLNFKGYREFQKALIYELAVRKEDSIKKFDKITGGDSLEEIADKVTYHNMETLEKSRKLVDYDVLEKALDELVKSKEIFLFGMGSSLLVAQDAYWKFMRLNKRCHIYDDWHGQILYAKSMTEQDVALMISYSGLTQEMIRCAEEVKKTGAKLIVITRFEPSPLAQMADYCLNVSSAEPVVRTGAMSSRISQLNMIDVLYSAYINRCPEENLENIGRTYMEKEKREENRRIRNGD